MKNINNSITKESKESKESKDNVMLYIASASVMHPHIGGEFCDEDQDNWGQFVDIDPTVPVVPMNQKKKPRWKPLDDTIKETPAKPECFACPEELHERTESWYKEFTGRTPRSPDAPLSCSTVCSHFEFLGKIAWYILHSITFIDYPIPITNTEEPHPQ
tara:strand:- start:1411 stop:1887 length:477 start_codon:yes stop_codon:yes gene_type:complete